MSLKQFFAVGFINSSSIFRMAIGEYVKQTPINTFEFIIDPPITFVSELNIQFKTCEYYNFLKEWYKTW